MQESDLRKFDSGLYQVSRKQPALNHTKCRHPWTEGFSQGYALPSKSQPLDVSSPQLTLTQNLFLGRTGLYLMKRIAELVTQDSQA
jgi:hypothetical protein